MNDSAPRLLDGLPPPTGDAAIVMAGLDTCGRHSATSRNSIAFALARETKNAPSPEAVEGILRELRERGLIERLDRKPCGLPDIDDGPGGDDEPFVATPLGRKAARLCASILEPHQVIAGTGGTVAELRDVVLREIANGATEFDRIDAACCCATSAEAGAALDALAADGLVERDRDGEFRLRPRGVARARALEEASTNALVSSVVGALRDEAAQHAIAALTSPGPSGDAGISHRGFAFDARDFHPEIVNTCRALFVGGHFANAILDACKRISQAVRDRANLRDDGDVLFASAFKPAGGLLRFNSLLDENDRNEQRGMMLLFQGAWAAIRNPNAHRFLAVNEVGALEHLGFLSMLFRYLDVAT